MKSTLPSDDDRLDRAEQVLVAHRQGVATIDIDAIVARHADLESELRELNDAYALVDTVLAAERDARDNRRREIERLLEGARALVGSPERYRFDGEVSRGGMGMILRVWDVQLNRPLAMKVLLGRASSADWKGTSVGPQHVARFLNEARITGQLDHPGIVPVHEIGVDPDGGAYFTMKLVSGRTLADVFAAHHSGDVRWTLPRVIGVLQRVAETLSFAHERGVIHRDLKPLNVMTGEFGEVYVMDWGLARRNGSVEEPLPEIVADEDDSVASTSPAGSRTRQGSVLGTPAYMPPEQARGEIESLEPRSDVYSLGAMLYELLAGHAPYCEGAAQAATGSRGNSHQEYRVSPSGHEILARVLTGSPVRLTSRAIPAELIAIQEKAMEREMAQRYPSAGELAADLQRFLDGRAVHAFATGSWVETRKWIERNRALAVSVASAVLFLAGGLVAVLRLKAESDLHLIRANKNELAAIANANSANESEKVAQQESARARTAEQTATQRLHDVLALSASRDLELLIAEADALWPVRPEMVPRYEKWLAAAQLLVDGSAVEDGTDRVPRQGLLQHQERLAALRASAVPELDEGRLLESAEHPQFETLMAARAELLWYDRMLGDQSWPEYDPSNLKADEVVRPHDDAQHEGLISKILDPKVFQFGRESYALHLAEQLLDFKPLGTSYFLLAWAQLCNGRLDAASSSMETAVSLFGEDNLEEYLMTFRAQSERWSAGELDARRVERSRVAIRVLALEIDVGERRFPHESDAWWHAQLASLVAGLEKLSDPVRGLMSEATSEDFGWGVAKRLKSAQQVRRLSGTDSPLSAEWTNAIDAIRRSPVYGGFELKPQVGLLPAGVDPVSGLWEFTHIHSGEPIQRDPNGRLAITELSGLVLVLIPGGTFWMGSQLDPTKQNYDGASLSSERPVHEVQLSPFFMAKHELTQLQWIRLAGVNPSHFTSGEYSTSWSRSKIEWTGILPVESVSWLDCTRVLTRFDLTLPTEAQWEYSARAGSSDSYWTGGEIRSLQGAENVTDTFWMKHNDRGAYEKSLDDGFVVLSPVCTFRANNFGLHDILGNVQEWCRDSYAFAAYSNHEIVDPYVEKDALPHRIARGGCWDMPAIMARTASRANADPSMRSGLLGVRPARGIDL